MEGASRNGGSYTKLTWDRICGSVVFLVGHRIHVRTESSIVSPTQLVMVPRCGVIQKVPIAFRFFFVALLLVATMFIALLVADVDQGANPAVTVSWSGGLAEILPAEVDLLVDWVQRTIRSGALLLPCAAFGILTAAKPPLVASAEHDRSAPQDTLTYHTFTTALFDRSTDGSVSVVAICAPFPWYGWLSDSLKFLRDAMKPVCHEIRLWSTHSGLVFDHWVKGVQAVGVPAAAASGAAFRPSLRAVPWWERYATDPMLTPLHEVALPPLHVLCKAYAIEQVRTLQSILLAGESLVICSPFVQVASAIVVSLPSMLSPLPCLHAMVTYASASDAITCLAGSASRHVIGLCPSALPQVIVAQYKQPFSTPCWIADARTGRVGRCPAAVHPQRSLLLLPPMEKFKEVYRRGFAVQSELFNALSDGFAALLSDYRRGIARATSERNSGAAIDVASCCGSSSSRSSSDVALNAFLVQLGASASWKLFSRKLVEVEQQGREHVLIPALRTGSVVMSSGAALEWSALSHSAACFQFHCARKTPELYSLEWAMAGKPLTDSSSAGKKILGFFEKAREAVVTQFSGPLEVEVPGCAQQYCQCDDLLQVAVTDGSSKATSSANAVIRGAALHSKTSGGVPSPVSAVFPADVVHHFDLYHPLLSAFTGLSTASLVTSAAQIVPPPQAAVMVAPGIEALPTRAPPMRGAVVASDATCGAARRDNADPENISSVAPSGTVVPSTAAQSPTSGIMSNTVVHKMDPTSSVPTSIRGSPARTPTVASVTDSAAPARSPVASRAMDSLFGGISLAGESHMPRSTGATSPTANSADVPSRVSPTRTAGAASTSRATSPEVPATTAAKGPQWNMDDLFR